MHTAVVSVGLLSSVLFVFVRPEMWVRVYEVKCEVIALHQAIFLVLSVCILCNLFQTLKCYDTITGIKSS